MKALTYHGPRNVKVDVRPDPYLEHPQDVVLRVTTSTICGSDLHLWGGFVPDTRVGQVFGHEFVGVVEEVGQDVRSLKRGDRVAVPFNIACGTCFFCERGLTASCANTNPNSDMVGGVYGYSHTTGGYDGGQAEYVRVPFADVGPMKIPDDMTDEQVLFLTDIFPTGYQAAEMGDIQQGDTVIVFGAGPVGFFAAKSAWLLGAGRVIVVDQVDYRLELARLHANAEIVDMKQHKDVLSHLKQLTDGLGADVCIDCVGCEADGSLMHTVLGRKLKLEAGAPTAIEWAIHAARRAGRVSIVGVYGPPYNLVPMGVAMNKGLTMRMGQCNTRRYMPRLLEHIREGRIDPTVVISHTVPLDVAPEGYRTFSEKKDNAMKIVLKPHGMH